MKEKIIISVAALLFSMSAYAQKAETVYYNNSWGVLGTTETLLIPDGDVYLLKRIYHGKLGGTSTDTLHVKDGVLRGKKFEVLLTDSRMVLHFLEDGSWTKKLKFKEHNLYSSFVNQRRSLK